MRDRIRQVTIIALLLALATSGVGATTSQLGTDPVTLETSFDPATPSAGADLTIATTITIDPEGTDDDDSIVWTVRFSEIGGLTVTDAACVSTPETTCGVDWTAGSDAVIFEGTIGAPGADPISLDVTIDGTIADAAEQVAAVTCAEAFPLATGATPAATPGPAAACTGEQGSIAVPVNPPVVPTELPTEAPTEIPTEQPTATTSPSPTPEPTATTTPAPSATSEPTVTSTPEPTATAEPPATGTSEPTSLPTNAPTEAAATATSQPGPTTTPDPTATATPTETPEPTATVPAPTEPSATSEPTATVTPVPTPDDGDNDSSLGLWVGVGALVVLAGAAGVVWNQRRHTS